jgi:hypothetical protein
MMFVQRLALNAANLFRYCEANEVVKRDPILVRQNICDILQRYCQAKWEGHASFFVIIHHLDLLAHMMHFGNYMFRILDPGISFGDFLIEAYAATMRD